MFEFPEDLSALSGDDLTALEAQASEAFDALPAADDPSLTDEQAAEMESIANGVSRIREQRAANEAAASSRAERAAAAAAAMSTAPGEEDPAEDPAVEEDDEEDDPVVEQAPQAVAASARPAVVRQARKTPPPQAVAPKNALSLTVAPDVPGFVAGSDLADLGAVAKAFSAKANGFPQTANPSPGVYLRHGVAQFSRNLANGGLTDDNPDYRNPQALLDAAGDEKRLSGNSLTAAGGWCAPSETLYDLCAGETLDGLLDLPTIQVNRGGIRFTQGPDFSAIYANTGFTQTEAQAIAGTTKPCYEIPCPPFTEVRLDVVGVCIKAPILTNAGYPELVERWISGSMVAHEHKVSARLIAAMQTLIGAAVTAPVTGSAAHSTLTALELAATGIRYRYRLSTSETLEVVAPIWLKAAIRADYAIRSGAGSAAEVSDEQINSHFAQRGLRVQWVYGYGDTRIVTPNCLVDYPDTAEVMIYRAGTFVKGTSDVISLDTVYDTADLQVNVYTAVFTEEGVLIAQRCPGACRVTIPVCVSGRTGAHDITACYGATDA